MRVPGVSPEGVGDRRDKPFLVAIFDMEESYLVVIGFVSTPHLSKRECFQVRRTARGSICFDNPILRLR